MTESEIPFSERLPKFDDPESPDRCQSSPRPIDFDDDDDEDDEPLTLGQKMFGIYERFFTPEERKKFAAMDVNDPTYEINLMRQLLFDTFAMASEGPKDKKSPLPTKFQYDLLTTVCRAVYTLSRLVALHMKLYNTRREISDAFDEVVKELDPYDMSTYDWDLT